MTRTILVAGTASHVGKSTVAAGLCRLLTDRGVSVAPFKAQNMSNNARVVARATGNSDDDGHWGEIGVSQFVQARAARLTPTTDCNPVLLKPRGEGESQLLIDGRGVGHYRAGSYYEDHWHRAREAAETAYERLAEDHEVIVAEGAGSIAEINLHDRDLANLECARFTDAEVLLLVDIERGGAFASLYGTLELLPEDVRQRVSGAVITKFRGDVSLLEDGIREIEARTGVPILGVLPYDDPGLPEEDSVALPPSGQAEVRGATDGVSPELAITIAVPRLPRLSNAADLETLTETPGVRIRYVPVDHDDRTESIELEDADAVVIPGTKNTVDDLRALKVAGFGGALESFGGPIIGLCGGYQMLGERLRNVTREAAGDSESDTLEGFGLLPVETVFERTKRVSPVTVSVDPDASPLLSGAPETASGYEIHTGRTHVLESGAVTHPLGPESAAQGLVLGTYLHGLFDNSGVRDAIVGAIRAHAAIPAPPPSSSPNAGEVTPYDRAAALLEGHLDLEALELAD